MSVYKFSSHNISILVVVCLVAMATSVCGFYSSSDDVVELTPSNFNKLVIQGDEVWMVEFYAPWYEHHIILINIPHLINAPCLFSKYNDLLTGMNSCLLHEMMWLFDKVSTLKSSVRN